jgi:hypothetical protein
MTDQTTPEVKPAAPRRAPRNVVKTAYVRDRNGEVYPAGLFTDVQGKNLHSEVVPASKSEVYEFLLATGKSEAEAKEFADTYVAELE